MEKAIVIRENQKTHKFDLFITSKDSSYEMKIKNVNCTTLAGAERAADRYRKFFNINQ